jgi:hypothetical protein
VLNLDFNWTPLCVHVRNSSSHVHSITTCDGPSGTQLLRKPGSSYVSSSERSVPAYQTKQCPEDYNINLQRRESLTSPTDNEKLKLILVHVLHPEDASSMFSETIVPTT